MASLRNDEVKELRSTVKGSVLLPGDVGYDEARTIWNAMIDRHPAVIVRCTGADDVVRAIGFARAKGLRTAVRGGGHNIAGNAVCDGGLVIDLSGMKQVTVDAPGRRAQVGPGATLGDFDKAAQAAGLATPLGINSTTGVAGLTLGGGFGWLTRKYGLTVDNLLAAEVVTASGERLQTSDREHPDLFWALRGGGGNFGVVTRFDFRLHPVGPNVLSGLIVFPGQQARQVLARYRDFVATIPEDLNVWVVLRKAPPLPFLPPEVHGTDIIALAVFGIGPEADGMRQVETLRGFGTPVGEHVGVQPYTAWQQAFDPLLTPGARNYWKSHNFTALADGALDAVAKYAGALPSLQTEIFIGLLGGEASRHAMDATAYAQRDAQFVMNVHGRWENAEDDKRCIGWAREFFAATKPFASGGVYVNFLTEEESDRIAAAYGPNYARLVEVKKRYDPDNFFRLNQNISPGG